MPFEELFAHEYQPEYISLHGDINVGPYKYNVFKTYSVAERQKAFQDCKKFLNWQLSEVQGEWELCMYMYQWIIKSPYPFPYSEYILSEDITMAISWDTQISKVNVVSKKGDVNFKRTDSEMPANDWSISFSQVPLETTAERLALLDTAWTEWQAELANRSSIAALITNLEQLANANLDAREV